MKLHQPNSEFYIPDQVSLEEALSRTTHMAIGAHQDDLEIMAYHGIVECFQSKEKHFTAVVVTDGAGSARNGLYEHYTDDDMKVVRRIEQKKAAYLGEYALLALLDYPSTTVKSKEDEIIVSELKELILQSSPEVIYTHNLADKHDTHIGVVTKVIKALRLIPQEKRPLKVYGCEVWRGLDWVNDDEKISLDVSKHPNLASSLVEVFDSQIIGGKRYDLATIGRRLANATYSSSHAVDETNAITYAMDLTPLILDDTLDVTQFVLDYINRFKQDVENKINKML